MAARGPGAAPQGSSRLGIAGGGQRRARIPRLAPVSLSHATPLLPSTPSDQVIGNKWDTYLELLQADYSET
jgi:hypothetical protein